MCRHLCVRRYHAIAIAMPRFRCGFRRRVCSTLIKLSLGHWNTLLLAEQRVFQSSVSISRPRIKSSRWRHAGKPSMHIARAHAFLARAPAPSSLATPNNGFQLQRKQLNDGVLMRALTTRHVMVDIGIHYGRRMLKTLSAGSSHLSGITQSLLNS